MAQTTHFNLEKPDNTKDVDEEFIQLQTTFDQLDSILKTLQDGISGKASASHGHAIADIVDLSAQLEGKMPASQTFKLDDLTDVSGADGAANGYLLVKSATGWVPSSPAAALGTHGHAISDITGLTTALTLKADADAVATALGLKADQATSYTKTEVDGKTTIASEAEAQGFTDNTKLLTPLRGLQLATAYNRWKTIRLIDLAGISVVNETDLSAFAMLRFAGEYIHAAAGETGQLLMRLSTDNGANYTASGYARQTVGLSAATVFGAEASSQTALFIGLVGGNNAAQTFNHQLNGFNKVGIKRMVGGNGITYNSGSDAFYNLSQRMENKSYAAANAIRFLTNTSTIASGLLHIEGIEG